MRLLPEDGEGGNKRAPMDKEYEEKRSKNNEAAKKSRENRKNREDKKAHSVARNFSILEKLNYRLKNDTSCDSPNSKYMENDKYSPYVNKDKYVKYAK